MKNLKKVLALGLALVMLLGMFTMASAAKVEIAQDFTDWNEVEHKDAVALCVDLGIINGLKDGSFDPKGTIDRASWAKLVYFTATGDDNANVYKDANTGMTDIADSWARGYINFLIANDYASGDGNGHFLPTSSITVAGGLKTMLTVLGYDAEDRGYQHDKAWMGNIMTDAKRNGLMEDVDSNQTAAAELTRENAAQIVYNALQANIVEPVNGRDNGEKYVMSYSKGATLGYDVFRAIPVTATVADVDKNGVATFENTDPSGFDSNIKDVKASSTLKGEKATIWIKTKNASFNDKGEMTSAGTFVEVVSTTAAKAASAADKYFTKGVDLDKLIAADDTKDDDYIGAEATGVKYYVDGKEVAKATANTDAKKAGNEVAIFLTDGKVSLVKVTTWTLAQVTADAETRTRNDEVQVKLDGVFAGWVAADKVNGWQGLAENDVVLVNKDSNDNYTIEKAEKVAAGKVTLRSGLKLTINGTQYGMSGITSTADDLDVLAVEENNDKNIDWDVKGSKDNEYDFYLDKNGTICAYKQVSGEVAKEVAYVLQSAWVGGNGSIAASKYGEVELLFTDGTTQIVNVSKVDGKKLVAKASDPAKDDEVVATTVLGENGTVDGKLIDFSIDSKGVYEIELKDEVADLTAGAVSQKPAVHDGLTADSKTVFMVKKGDDFYTYTGYKNVPEMTATKVVAVAKDGIATYVYFETEKFKGDGSKGLIWVKDVDTDRDTSGNDVYNVVDANGADVKMALVKHTDLAEIEPQTFYIVDSIDDDGVATIKAATGDTIKTGTTMTAKNSTMVLGEDKLEYDGDTVAVIIDLNTDEEFSNSGKLALNNYKEDTTSYNYAITVIVDGTHADFVYVVRTEIDQTAGEDEVA